MKKQQIIGCLLALLVVGFLYYVEQFLQPGYWIKSLLKLVTMGGVIFVCTGKDRCEALRLRRPKSKGLLLFCAAAYAGILILFFLLKPQLNLESIRAGLLGKENLTKGNCLLVFLYIILVNSFLEELFFRGFVFQLFEKPAVGGLISALLFAVYHIGMVSAWFSPWIFALCIAGLAVVGIGLQWIGRKSLLASWVVHGSANLAINTIGAYLIFFEGGAL